MFFKYQWLVILLCILSPLTGKAYSVLTHEAIIDASWESSIQPLLKLKYPGATEDQLKHARAYAYGGAIVPDMGYYPFGSIFFTSLVHYVRSGDFVIALLDEAQDINEYAFAIGVLCHYNADDYGHALGINVSVPLVYPEIKAKYGNVVTYAQDHASHIRTEFGFDVLQTARGNYAPEDYHDFIGFEISRPVLERAFLKTYGLNINDVFGNLSLSISTFRWSVKNLFPEITKSAWASKKSEIIKSNPVATGRTYIYRINRVAYIKEFGRQRTRPGFFAGVLAVIIKISPKIGPLKALKFKVPGAGAEKLFTQSFDTVVVRYSGDINHLDFEKLNLVNIDFDTGNKTAIGEYELTDKAYEELLLKLKEAKFNSLNAGLKKNIIDFYGTFPLTANVDDKDGRQKKKINEALEELRVVPAQ
jgi:hypothetical protein